MVVAVSNWDRPNPGGRVKQIPALPSLDFLLDCKNPKSILQEVELSSLEMESNCGKRAEDELEKARKYAELAGSARWLIENLEPMLDRVRNEIRMQEVLEFPSEEKQKEEKGPANWRPRYAGVMSTAKVRKG
jgi:hypothetical protein